MFRFLKSFRKPATIRPALQVLGIRPDVRRATGMYMMLLKNDVKFFADATLNIDPDAETLADTAIQVADAARAFEVVPRVAWLARAEGDCPPDRVRPADGDCPTVGGWSDCGAAAIAPFSGAIPQTLQ